jgi:hypothetical protein
VVITKSTVPVGIRDEVERILREANPVADVEVVSNPEFLREAAAIRDFKPGLVAQTNGALLGIGDAAVSGFSGTLPPDPARPVSAGRSAVDLAVFDAGVIVGVTETNADSSSGTEPPRGGGGPRRDQLRHGLGRANDGGAACKSRAKRRGGACGGGG